MRDRGMSAGRGTSPTSFWMTWTTTAEMEKWRETRRRTFKSVEGERVCGWTGEGNRRRDTVWAVGLQGRDTGTARRRQRADTLTPTNPSAKIADGNSLSRHSHTHQRTPATPSALSVKNISSPLSPHIRPCTDE